MNYEAALELQASAYGNNSRGSLQCHDAFLFFEAEPVVTYGPRSNPPGQLPCRSLRVSRGGLATYHGPGQWVIFPRLGPVHLGFGTRDVRRYLQVVCKDLIGRALKTAIEFAYPLQSDPLDVVLEGKDAGFWISSPRRKKIGSIGFRFRRDSVEHGVAINILPEALHGFHGFDPCGLSVNTMGAVFESKPAPELLAKFEKCFLAALDAALKELKP